MNQTDFTPSPCIRQCCLNERDICLGCYRSLKEILDWAAMDEPHKQATLERCEQRRLLAKKRP